MGDHDGLRLDLERLLRETEGLPLEAAREHFRRVLAETTERLEREIAEAEAILTARRVLSRAVRYPDTTADAD